jgi:hypothetical protein
MKKSRIAALAVACLTLTLVAAGPAVAAPNFASFGDATVTPGVQTFSPSGQCTANFIYTDAADNVYIGQAAHCTGTGEATDTNGCEAGSLPLGTEVEIDGAENPGTLAYSSWIAMQAANETDANACSFNDFALVRIDPADVARTNPSVPFWGGPTALNTTGTRTGDKVVSYGNSSLRLGIELLSPKEGASLGQNGGGWNHPVYTVTPGVPGDSGSGFMDRQGRAFGTLSTLAIAPLPASNGVSDLSRALNYAAGDGLTVSVVPGTVPFRGPLLPL